MKGHRNEVADQHDSSSTSDGKDFFTCLHILHPQYSNTQEQACILVVCLAEEESAKPF